MKRDIIKQAKKGTKIKNNFRDITSTELDFLRNMALQGSNGMYDALTTAFYFGFYQGYSQKKTGRHLLKAKPVAAGTRQR